MKHCFPQVGALQFRVELGSPKQNLASVRRLLEAETLPPETLVVLPELWATGFAYSQLDQLVGMTPGILEETRKLAEDHRIYLAGSLLEAAPKGELPWNTLFFSGPEGIIGRLRKQHLFGFWQEDRYFQAGRSNRPISTPYGPTAGLVCYDLRFPELAREQVYGGCSLLVVSAQWPAARREHWCTLLKARAIENQVFVAAANSCGTTGQTLMGGHSLVLGPDGGTLAALGDSEGICSFPLVDNYLRDTRARFCSMGERPWQRDDREKVLPLHDLLPALELIRHQSTRIAFTNGCFDILHSGHVSYLEEARRQADLLVVGLNSDRSVRRLKGDDRPVNGEQDRARVLAALGCVDYVVVFDESTPIDLIQAIRPDVLVKGADWPIEQIVGASEVLASGGRVERISFEHAVSTTAVIDRIRARD